MGFDELKTNPAGGLGSTLSFSGGSSSLKGKLLGLEELVRSLNDDINNHKKEIQILRSEKDTLESVLNMKVMDVRKTLMNELSRVEDEMKRHFAHQKAENSRLQQQITSLKGEKTALQQQLLALQRRISELESQIGSEAS
jgi:chromosome segregation ATPase